MKANVHLVLIFFTVISWMEETQCMKFAKILVIFVFGKCYRNTNFKNTSKIVQTQLSLLKSIYPEKILFQLINTYNVEMKFLKFNCLDKFLGISIFSLKLFKLPIFININFQSRKNLQYFSNKIWKERWCV